MEKPFLKWVETDYGSWVAAVEDSPFELWALIKDGWGNWGFSDSDIWSHGGNGELEEGVTIEALQCHCEEEFRKFCYDMLGNMGDF